jgi:hypothetical protein
VPHAAWVEIVPVPQQTGVDAVPAQSMGARQLKGVLVVAHAAAVPQVEVPDAGTQQVWPAVHVMAGVPLKGQYTPAAVCGWSLGAELQLPEPLPELLPVLVPLPEPMPDEPVPEPEPELDVPVPVPVDEPIPVLPVPVPLVFVPVQSPAPSIDVR